MKTQWQNLTNIIPGLINTPYLFQGKLIIGQAGRYLLPFLKQGFKDTFQGSEIELDFLLLSLSGYLLSAKKVIKSIATIKINKKTRLAISPLTTAIS